MKKIEIEMIDCPDWLQSHYMYQPFMKKGWKTWVEDIYLKCIHRKGETIYPENNKWKINFCSESFRIIEQNYEIY